MKKIKIPRWFPLVPFHIMITSEQVISGLWTQPVTTGAVPAPVVSKQGSLDLQTLIDRNQHPRGLSGLNLSRTGSDSMASLGGKSFPGGAWDPMKGGKNGPRHTRPGHLPGDEY